MLLVGNKVDLKENRQVSEKEGKDFSKEHAMLFFETSAKENKDVKESFDVLVEQILEKMMEDYQNQEDEVKQTIIKSIIKIHSLPTKKEPESKCSC